MQQAVKSRGLVGRLRGWRRIPLAGLLSVIGGLLLWELVSRYLVANALFLAGPSQIIRGASSTLARTGELGHHIGISAAEFAIGYVIASVLGSCSAAMAMAGSVTCKRIMQPWISGLYATPTIALAPLFILWLGIGIWSKVLVVMTLVLFPVTINTEAGLRTTSERLIEMLRQLRRDPQQIFFKVSLPSALPFVLAGIEARHRPRPDRRGGGGAVRLARRHRPPHQRTRPIASTCPICSPAWSCWRSPASS